MGIGMHGKGVGHLSFTCKKETHFRTGERTRPAAGGLNPIGGPKSGGATLLGIELH